MLTNTERDKERAREIILRYGWNATAYQLLNPGLGEGTAAVAGGDAQLANLGNLLQQAGSSL